MPLNSLSQPQKSKFESPISKKSPLDVPYNGLGTNIDQLYTSKDQQLAMSKRNLSLDKEKHQACDHHKIKEIIAKGFKIFRHNLDGDKMASITKKKGRVLFKKKTENYQVPKKKKKNYFRQLYVRATHTEENT